MRRERRGVGDERLFVADVDNDALEAADAGPRGGRNLHAAIRHHDEEPGHL